MAYNLDIKLEKIILKNKVKYRRDEKRRNHSRMDSKDHSIDFDAYQSKNRQSSRLQKKSNTSRNSSCFIDTDLTERQVKSNSESKMSFFPCIALIF